jgi:hypothetical protein
MTYTLTTDDLKILKGHYKEQRQSLVDQIKPLQEQIALLDIKLSQFDELKQSPKSVNSVNGYDKDWNWNQKIKYVLVREGKLTRSQIIEAILKMEPEKEKEKDSISNSIGATLSITAVKQGAPYMREKTESGAYLYCAA